MTSRYSVPWIALILVVSWIQLLPEARAQETAHAFVGARILPVSSEPIPRGTLVLKDGRILAVGPVDSTPVPEGASTRDVAGKTIIPGLICTHSHLGGSRGADGSDPIQPDVRVYDSLNVKDAGYRRAVAGGLTTLNVMPGSGHLLSGRTIYIKPRIGARIMEDFFILDEKGEPLGGVKMANGTNSRGDPPFPGSRAKSAALVRSLFVRAREYREKIARAGGDHAKVPPRDLGLETVASVLDKKTVVHFHTHRHDDIVTVLRLAREFDFRVVLHHVSDGWKVADQIAAAGVPCSIILLDSPGGKLEAVDLDFRTGAILEEAGVLTAFHTDDWITDSRLFLRMPALGVRAGMSREGALRAVTLAGAEMLDLADRIGSLDPGKDADFVLLSGDPFSVYTKVLETWIEGRKVFDREDPEDRLHAVGGYGANHDTRPYHCCFESEEVDS